MTTDDSVDVLFVQLTFLNCIVCIDSISVQRKYIVIVCECNCALLMHTKVSVFDVEFVHSYIH